MDGVHSSVLFNEVKVIAIALPVDIKRTDSILTLATNSHEINNQHQLHVVLRAKLLVVTVPSARHAHLLVSVTRLTILLHSLRRVSLVLRRVLSMRLTVLALRRVSLVLRRVLSLRLTVLALRRVSLVLRRVLSLRLTILAPIGALRLAVLTLRGLLSLRRILTRIPITRGHA